MSNDTWIEEEEFDITGPFALFMIAYLRWLSEKARTDAEKLEALRRCFSAYLVMNAGHYLFDGVPVLTNFILTEFTPFTEGRSPAEPNTPWLEKYPLTETISAECHAVPVDCFDLFITDEHDVEKLQRRLVQQGLVESTDSEEG